MLGGLTGGVLTLVCYLLMGALLWRGLTLPISLQAVGPYVAATFFFGLGCLFAYWTYGCLTLRYHLDRNGLVIHWGDIRQMIPMERIERLVPGRELPAPTINGVSWLGHHVGRAEVGDLGETLFYSTQKDPEHLLYVVTPSHSYAISVQDEVQFAEELQGHQRLGQVVSLPQVTERTSIASQPFWHDSLARTLALLSMLAAAVTVGYVFQQYPGLPDSIPLAFPSISGVTRVDDKSALLAIPITGLGLLAINLALGFILHAWERAVGYLLFAAAIGSQLILLSGAIITLQQ
ncbi:MAG: PH domain-containing protein [Dehalococcoidia bacterium]